MMKQDYLELLVENIHSTTIATIGADGHPQTRVIDIIEHHVNHEGLGMPVCADDGNGGGVEIFHQ